jgi:hypothetical protein
MFGNVFCNLNVKIHAFGFGDRLTRDENTFSFSENDNEYFRTIDEVLQRFVEKKKKKFFLKNIFLLMLKKKKIS